MASAPNINQQIVAPPAQAPSSVNYVAPGSAGNVASPAYTGALGNTVAQGYTPPSSGGTATPTAVVTSQPATDNYNSIQSTYQNTIQPNMNAAAQGTKAARIQANSLPVIPGYNVSPTPTGNQGETKATNNTTGQSYYITPQEQPVTASQVQGIISGTSPSTTASPDTSISSAATAAMNATGINPATENANYQSELQGTTDEMTQAYNTFQQTVQQIQSGSFPFSSAQQSLIDATNQAFTQMTTQANLKAAALSSETGGVSTKVNATAGELININSDQAAAIAKLEIGFEQTDYQMVTDSYNEYKDLETQKLSTLTDLHNSVMTTYNSALDAAEKQQQLDLQQAQFAEQQKKDAADEKNAQEQTAIAAADEGIKSEQEGIQAATFSAEYGGFINADGSTNTNVSVNNIPGYTTLPNGIPVIVNANGNYKTSNMGGISVISSTDVAPVTSASTALSLLSTIQAGMGNGGVPNISKENAAALNSMLKDLSSKYPQFSSLASFQIADSNDAIGLIKGLSSTGNLSQIRSSLISGLQSLIPNYHIPSSGQVFTSVNDATNYFTSSGNQAQYNQAVQQADQLAGGQASDAQILQILNAL